LSESEGIRPEAVRSDTERWLARAVVGLNLCPFAKAVQAKGLVHIAVSAAQRPEEVLDDLARELDDLLALDAAQRETTLLVVPSCLVDFLAFNDFLGRAEKLLRRRGAEGVIQLASFHPAYQFAGTEPDDIANCTNRSPYPTLHLLREASIDRAVAAFPDASAIYETNIETLRKLGPEGWAALDVGRSR
jgi:hypothetical protein